MLRRVLLAVVTIVVALGATIGLVMLMAGRDKSGVGADAGASGPGVALPDGGDRHLAPGDPRPRYATDPPASGAHRVVPVTRNAATLSDDQLLTALERGDVVVLYGTAAPPPGLDAVQRVAPFSPAAAREGQAVVLGRRPGQRGIVALAWRRELRTGAPSDPRLAEFADHWLGAGAPG